MSKALQQLIGIVLMSVFGLAWCLPVQALDGAWYVGVGAGASRLTPDTDGSPFSLEDDGSVAAGLYLGLDINDWLAAEVAYTELGEAGLSANETIGYSAVSVGGIAYVYGQRDSRARQQDLSGYVRFGLNSIQNDASIDLNKADNTALWLGAGLQWPVGEQWGLRGEIASYDGDAQSVMASVYWRSKPDERTRRTGREPAARIPAAPQPRPVPRPATAPAPTPTPTPTPAPTPVPVPVPVPVPAPSQAPQSPENLIASDCAPPAPSEPRDSQGCALFTGVLQGVEFQADTALLTPVAQTLLARLATSLNQYPNLIAEIQVHTQVYAEPGRAMQLSRERVLNVARFLASQSVNVKRLRARAFGSEQPRADNDSAGGRRLNNRVTLRILP